MSRRRSTPWIHRWSRLLIVAIALLGALNTGYLSLTKLLGGEAACPTEGCQQVLSGPYATVLGLPLALYGFLAYLAILGLAGLPLVLNPETQKDLRTKAEKLTWPLLFAGTTAMVVFSSYLMYIMVAEYVAVYGPQATCFFCVASALFATALFVLTLIGHAWEDIGQILFTGIVVGMVTLIGTLGVYANPNGTQTTATNAGPPIVATSTQAEIALAKHLSQMGAKMYGAYWCPHCHDQKELFGKQAFALVNYIECDPTGVNPNPQACSAAGVRAYPSWEIKGQLYQGARSLTDLATLSGYQGPQNFQSTVPN